MPALNLLSFPSAQRDNEMRQIERRAQDQVDLERRRVKETEEQLAAVRQQLDRAAEGLEAAARWDDLSADMPRNIVRSLLDPVFNYLCSDAPMIYA